MTWRSSDTAWLEVQMTSLRFTCDRSIKRVSKTVWRAASEAELGPDVLLPGRFQLEPLWIYLSDALHLQRQPVGWSAVVGGIRSDLLCHSLQGPSVTTATGEACFFPPFFFFSFFYFPAECCCIHQWDKARCRSCRGGQETRTEFQEPKETIPPFFLLPVFSSNSQNPCPVEVTRGFLPVKPLDHSSLRCHFFAYRPLYSMILCRRGSLHNVYCLIRPSFNAGWFGISSIFFFFGNCKTLSLTVLNS